MNTNTVVALFDYYSDADRAVRALQDYGVDGGRISVVTRGDNTIERGTNVGAGAATGAAAGGLFGLLAGLSTLSVPGIGPVVATGTLASALATTLGITAVGAATGGLLGSLIDIGLPADDAEVYAEGVKRGGILIFVEADADDENEIRDILRRAGAEDIDIRRQIWEDAGWTSFDETEKSDVEAYRR